MSLSSGDLKGKANNKSPIWYGKQCHVLNSGTRQGRNENLRGIDR